MKKILYIIFVSFLFIPNFSFSGELKKISDKSYEVGSKYFENYLGEFLGGIGYFKRGGGGATTGSSEGETEVSLRIKSEERPIGSIMITRPIDMQEDALTFYQAQLNSHYVSGDIRQSINLGLGTRKLADNNTLLGGANIFFDVDTKGNTRMSFGGEYRRAAFDLTGNYYMKMGGGKKIGSNTERVLSGYDVNLVGRIFPWADVVFTNYNWTAEKNSSDSEGNILAAEVFLNDNLTLEFGADDNNIDETESFAKIMYSYPGKDRYTVADAKAGKEFKLENVKNKMLSKVRRSNVITIEIEGSGVVVSRGN